MTRSVFRLSVLTACFFLMAAAPPPKQYPWLGLDFRWRTDTAGHRFIQVDRVAPAGPSQRAGLLPGDIIRTIDGTRVGFGDELEFLLFLSEKKPGQRLALGVVRAGHPQTMVVTLGVLPEAARARWEQGLRVAREKRRARQAAQ